MSDNVLLAIIFGAMFALLLTSIVVFLVVYA
jgi:hypothetical protein